MKAALKLLLVVTCLLALPMLAQAGKKGKTQAKPMDADVKASVELTAQYIQTQRQAIVAKNLELTDQESEKFWKEYRNFQNDRRNLVDKEVKLIADYAKNYDSMKDGKAQSLLNTAMKNDEEMLKLKKKYVKKFQKFMPSKKVARWFQIENKMDAVVNYEMAHEIPLVK